MPIVGHEFLRRWEWRVYGQVAGAGFSAGVPAALAFTGVTSRGFALTLGVAMTFIFAGTVLLRLSYRSR